MDYSFSVTATINVRTSGPNGRTSTTTTCKTPDQLAEEAAHILVQQWGTEGAKKRILTLLDRYKPKFQGYTKAMKHEVRQYSDQMLCSCGAAWDVNDPEPPEGH